MPDSAPIVSVQAQAYRVPTDEPESDGTFAWDATTLVLARIQAGGCEGLGYSYAASASATLVRDALAQVLLGRDALQTAARYAELIAAVRNIGRRGIAALAISALDVALWDLKGKLLGQPVVHLLGGVAREAIPIYGSGGFTSYTVQKLQSQLEGWVEQGITRVKMKVGREPQQDALRVGSARQAIGEQTQLFVDANGGYSRKQALALARSFAEQDVRWFEEPVPSDDVAGLRLIRDRAPAGMDIAAGEYGFDPLHFRGLLEAGAVDVLQADATRCGGFTGFMRAAALCDAFGLPLSSHCAPALHVPVCCCAPTAVHLEWFHDHQRIERMLFEGAPEPIDGVLRPNGVHPGLGLVFKSADAQEYAL